MAIQITEKCIRHQHQWSNCHRCISACPEQAVEFRLNIAINATKCTECEICLFSCPFEAIENNHKNKYGEKLFSRRALLGLSTPKVNKTTDLILPLFQIQFDEEKCTLCGLCNKFCQKNCIQISADKISIDSSKCIGCQLCVDICQMNAIYINKIKKKLEKQIVRIYTHQCSTCHQVYQTTTVFPKDTYCPACIFRKDKHISVYKIGQNAV